MPIWLVLGLQWPMRHMSLLLAARAYGRHDCHALWRTLPADSTVDEGVRNWFVRQRCSEWTDQLPHMVC